MRVTWGSLDDRRGDLRIAIPTSLGETSYHRWLCILRYPELPSELVGRDAEDAHLQTILNNLRKNQMSQANFEKMSERLIARQPMTVIQDFQNAPRIYYQNDRVDRHNRPVKLSIAKNFPPEAESAITVEAANLEGWRVSLGGRERLLLESSLSVISQDAEEHSTAAFQRPSGQRWLIPKHILER